MWKWCLVGLAVAIGVGLQACAPRPASEKACNFVQNVNGERISWKSDVPIRLMVHSSVPQQFIPAIEEAIRIWEDSAGRKLFDLSNEISYGPLSPRQDGASVIYWMNTWEDSRMSEQARTSVYWLGDQIQEADIRVNDKRFNFYMDQPQSSDEVHIVSLMVHELGHVLGLKHNDKDTSVMATYLRASTARDVVSTADVSSLSCEY